MAWSRKDGPPDRWDGAVAVPPDSRLYPAHYARVLVARTWMTADDYRRASAWLARLVGPAG
jgi:hypothetical protein